jgi:hypothetical protein
MPIFSTSSQLEEPRRRQPEMHFEIVTPIAKTEIIASGAGVRLSPLLRKQYGFLIKLYDYRT